MGIFRIIADFDVRRLGEIIGQARAQVRDWWRGWTETDIDHLIRKLDDPLCYSGGIFKISVQERRAWVELNRRLQSQDPGMVRSPVIAWADGEGLFPMIRLLPSRG